LAQINQLSRHHIFISNDNPVFDAHWDWLDVNYWRASDSISGQSTGRSATYLISHPQGEYVLRHYYRGGAIRHISKDNYLYCGLEKTRVYTEFSVLEQLKAWDLPAPVPIAGRIIRQGFIYTADLLMAKIPDAVDVFQHLLQQPLTAAEWQTMGATIAQFHQRGVCHADLNCHNLMLDQQGKIWLIDFDRAEIKPQHPSWTAQNLGRLYRSFIKEKHKHTPFYFEDNDWEQLLIGYDSHKK
jgi:3-deoxy-D-manno-octulosonic acid kinase